MDYKKKYEEALANAKMLKEANPSDEGIQTWVKETFPELEELENERIRKELTEFLKKASGGFLDTTTHCKTFGKWLAWLEKQGEQKSAWSEEDEYLLGETIQHLEELIRIEKVKHCGIDVQYYQRDIDWLKSLKQRLNK